MSGGRLPSPTSPHLTAKAGRCGLQHAMDGRASSGPALRPLARPLPLTVAPVEAQWQLARDTPDRGQPGPWPPLATRPDAWGNSAGPRCHAFEGRRAPLPERPLGGRMLRSTGYESTPRRVRNQTHHPYSLPALLLSAAPGPIGVDGRTPLRRRDVGLRFVDGETATDPSAPRRRPGDTRSSYLAALAEFPLRYRVAALETCPISRPS